MAVVIIFLTQNIWWFLSRPTFSANISKNVEHSCAKMPSELIERFMNNNNNNNNINNNNNKNNNNNNNNNNRRVLVDCTTEDFVHN